MGRQARLSEAQDQGRLREYFDAAKFAEADDGARIFRRCDGRARRDRVAGVYNLPVDLHPSRYSQGAGRFLRRRVCMRHLRTQIQARDGEAQYQQLTLPKLVHYLFSSVSAEKAVVES